VPSDARAVASVHREDRGADLGEPILSRLTHAGMP
jgi:hypothetical protein